MNGCIPETEKSYKERKVMNLIAMLSYSREGCTISPQDEVETWSDRMRFDRTLEEWGSFRIRDK